MTTVLVTGATGNVGSNIVRELQQRGARVRAFVRDPQKASATLGPDVELAVGDFRDAASLTTAMRGVDAVCVLTPNHPQQELLEIAIHDAAAASGVRRLVKMSSIGAEVGAPLEFWDVQGRLQAYARRTTPSATILRSNFYMSALLGAAPAVQAAGQIFAPAAGARIAMIDPRDVAAAAATILMTGSHEGETVTLSGPEAITYDRIAEVLSDVAGKPVAFIPVPDDAARQAMVGSGMPEWLAGNLVTLFGLLRGGAGAEVTDGVRRITGREPRSFADFARDHAAAFGSAPA